MLLGADIVSVEDLGAVARGKLPPFLCDRREDEECFRSTKLPCIYTSVAAYFGQRDIEKRAIKRGKKFPIDEAGTVGNVEYSTANTYTPVAKMYS